MQHAPGWVGPLHTALGFLCLALGTAIVSARKGTRQHQRLGPAYAAAMFGLPRIVASQQR